MKKALLILCVMVSTLAKAQDGFKFITLRGGYTYQKAYEASIALDFATTYHGAFELSGTYYRNNPHKTFNVLLGGIFKPVVFRNKNFTMRWRMGGEVGTDWKNFIAIPQLGFDFNQSVSQGIDIVLTNHYGYGFWAQENERWRATFQLGIRLSI